jgi:hypothetical protein
VYPRNAASPPRIAIGAVVQISDGAVQTSGVSVSVRPNGGSESSGGGTISYGASGIVYYAPTQGETDYTDFVVVAYKAGCIPVATTIVTSASATSGKVVLSGETHASAVIPTVSTLTNAPSDSSGTTTLLSRVTSTRAGYLDNLSGGAVALQASLLTVAGYLDTEIAAILEDTGTTIPAQIAALAIPSASAVASQVRTELATELARIDVATSTRLATAGYSAPLDAAGVRSALGLASANLDTQLADLPTNSELATAITTGLTTALTEGYRADGSTGSVRDLLYELIAHMGEASIVSTTKTIKKIDGSTTAATYTLDSGSAPTSITRAS